MSYAGLTRGGQRADLINYLHTLSDNPVPLPKGGGGGASRTGSGKEIADPPGSEPAAGSPCPAVAVFGVGFGVRPEIAVTMKLGCRQLMSVGWGSA